MGKTFWVTFLAAIVGLIAYAFGFNPEGMSLTDTMPAGAALAFVGTLAIFTVIGAVVLPILFVLLVAVSATEKTRREREIARKQGEGNTSAGTLFDGQIRWP